MRYLLCAMFLVLAAVPAVAQPPWYARGEFNGWSTDNQMAVDPGDATHYTAHITGLFDNTPYPWKIAGGGADNWATSAPTTDSRVYTDSLGEINFHLWNQTSWSDGWLPNNERRVGYDDHQQFDWEIVGSFNGWSNPPDPNFALTDMGNGLHRGTFAMNAGIYDFKFRGLTAIQWDNTIGNNFGNGAGNNTIAVTSNGDLWNFELDLPNGRWRAYTDAAPPGQEGDFNKNGLVDAADYTKWRDNFGSNTALPNDPNGTPVANASYNTWKAHFGQGTAVQWLARSVLLGDQPLVNQGGGKYQLNMTGLTPVSDYEFKVVRSDLSASVPGSNMKVRANASGEIDLNFYELPSGGWTDGWSPANMHRLGYKDHQEFDWQLTGSFIGWVGNDAYNLTDQGNGLHTGAFTFDTIGTHQFKIRQYNDWNTSIGDDFGNSAGNNSFTVNSTSELWHFELDLPNGRWRVYLGGGGAGAGVVPEPGSLAIALAGLLIGTAAVRRRR